ncbi:L,D-transpeptidase family protein [Streptomyces durmitorensis]|uniref:L,D-transpeptidase family protein n=1 Tax=Streptomyces durmitorensis TaxID=319947 RepID=A0ABY4PSJ9_9ACTN|nr:L,D-transpeptidase family protein [Streptomyces durmitorensis]UQT56731.1 L,D-transpeptidase family protein [Streptomyces durmitorensis]
MTGVVVGKGAIAVGAVVAVALVGGCKAQAVDSDGKAQPVRISPTKTKSDGTGPDEPSGPSKGTAEGPSEAAPTPEPAPKTLLAPGQRGDQVRELQARLRQIAWFFDNPSGTYGSSTTSAVKGFQGKRGLPRTGTTDTVTWQKLVGMTREPTKYELYSGGGIPASKPDKRCMTGRVLCISKESRTLTWMIDGKAVSTMDVRFGSQYTPTRDGTFTVYWKSRHHVSTLYDTAMPYAMFFSGGQAVHYSSDFAATGYNGASHGCVNVRDEKKIASLFSQVKNGDKVVVYK